MMLLWVVAPAVLAVQGPARPEPHYAVRLEPSVMVPMRDGIRLSTDLYFPEGVRERLPAVLMRTPYDKNRARGEESTARWFAGQGYVVAVQDKRGKYESEGLYVVSGGDVPDGDDTINWLARQSWSTGKVGTYGCSYLGEVQVKLAQSRNPNLAAMIPQAAGGGIGTAGDRYRYFGAWNGGAFELAAGVGWFREAGSKRNPAPALPTVDYRQLWSHLPLVDIMDAAKAPPTDWREFVSHGLSDPWWDQFDYLTDADRFDVPALHVNSWYDFGVAETLYEFNLFRRNAVSPLGRDHQYVIISPTTHCRSESATERTIVGQRDVGDARFDFHGAYLRWFDHWLKGMDNEVTRMPKVQIYVMGRNQWRAESEWPLARTEFTRYYLHSDGGANSRSGTGTLATVLPGDEPGDTIVYDPGNPVPSVGGPICCTGTPDAPEGAFDQSAVETRNDVLVYTTPPLERGIEVTGPIQLVMYVSSSAKDTDFTGKLVDVYPDGHAYNVQEGILRARYREGFGRTVWMERGGVYQLTIDLQATSNYFGPGHRIRLEVSSSNFPRFDRNLNTGGNNYSEIAMVAATNTVHHSQRYPSHVVLPVVP